MQIGKYEVLQEIGRGGLGVVYKARNLSTNSIVALKVIHSNFTLEPASLESFRNLANLLRTKTHPNLVKIHEHLQQGGQFVLCMDYLPGGNLENLSKKTGAMPLHAALPIIRQIVSGLAFVHNNGIIHGDLKPSNILFDQHGEAVLSDVALSGLVRNKSTSAMTTGKILESMRNYRAPELWRGGRPSFASDQYSLACIVVEMLTGTPLFAAEDLPATLMKHLKPVLLPVQIPESIRPVLLKALDKDPNNRFQSVGDFLAALERQVNIQPVEKSSWIQPSLDLEVRRINKRRVVPAWLWGALGVVWLVALVFILQHNGVLADLFPWLTEKQSGLTATIFPPSEAQPADITSEALTEPQPTPNPTDEQTFSQSISVGALESYEKQTSVREKDGMEMTLIPAGEFAMGCDPAHNAGFGCYESQLPLHTVYLDAYWIDVYEVRNDQYNDCVQAGSCSPLQEVSSAVSGSVDTSPMPAAPVVQVDWNAAQRYCEYVGGRLPTEAEWEKAARGTDLRAYPWGEQQPGCGLSNSFDDQELNYCVGEPQAVGSLSDGASLFGVQDMAGNVWEWVADWYDPEYYTKGFGTNPLGPNSGTLKVIRGGSWGSNWIFLTSTMRYSVDPGTKSDFLGFRCVYTEGLDRSSESTNPGSTVQFIEQPGVYPDTPVERARSKDGMEMIQIPEGEFIMGGNRGEEDERPAHRVYLDSFWIDKYEVSNGQYALCVSSGNCDKPKRIRSYTQERYYGNAEYDNYPVIYLTWYNAEDYCEWVGARLPTEAEWEKAAKGVEDQTYPWGEQSPTPELANYGNKLKDTLPVDSFPNAVSPYGVFNMAGNVWEWVADWYAPYPRTSEVQYNPFTQDYAESKVFRGGSWNDDAEYLRVANRGYAHPESWDYLGVGFRCASSYQP